MKTMRHMFYSLLLCFFFVGASIGTQIVACKIFGWRCDMGSITFGMVFSIVWIYFHKEVETFMKEESKEEKKK